MPIEFTTKPGSEPQPDPSQGQKPAVTFAMPQGRSQQQPSSSVAWLWAFIIIWPFVGVLIGAAMLQECRHARERGNPWTAARKTAVVVPTAISLVLTIGIGLFLAVS